MNRAPLFSKIIFDLPRGIKPGTVVTIDYHHDDGCPAVASQRMDRCTCTAIETTIREVVA